MDRVLQLAAAALCACTAASAAPSPWQQFHGGPGHAGTWDGTINPDKVELRWSLDPSGAGLGLDSGFMRASQPCVSADESRVFVYGEVAGAATTGRIVAIDAFTGAIEWSAEVLSRTDFDSLSSPIYHQGYVYWAGSDGAGAAVVYRINAASGLSTAAAGGWEVTLPGSCEVVNATPLVADGRLYISTSFGFDPAATRHFALRLADGSIAWSNNDGGQGQGAMAYDADRGLVYQSVFDGSDHRLAAYDAADGTVAWTSTWAFTNNPYQCGIAYRDGVIYVQDTYFGAGDANAYAADAANVGELVAGWPAATPGSGNACPAVDDAGNVYVLTGTWAATGSARALTSAGAEIWTSAVAGDWASSAAWADGYVFAGDEVANQLHLLSDADGSSAKAVAGCGPVAFGHRAFFTVGTDGILYAYSTSSDFATEVVEYVEGTAVGTDYVSGDPYNDPATALGRPTVDTTGYPTTETNPVVPVNSAWRSYEIVTVGTGGRLILKMDHQVWNDANNPFGTDFIVFGNSCQAVAGGAYWENGDPNLTTAAAGTIGAEPGIVSVSQDGVTWYTFSSGPRADTHAPTLGRVYEDAAPWWGEPTDATLALDPAFDAAAFAGMTVAGIAQAYGRSAGGTGFDVGAHAIEWFRYVKIEDDPGSGATTEVDSVADARVSRDVTAPGAVTGLSLAPAQGRVDLLWTNPAAGDFAGVVVLRRAGAAVAESPADARGYAAGEALGASTVAYVGAAEALADTNLVGDTTYHYAVFAFDNVLNYSAGVAGSAAVPATPTIGLSAAALEFYAPEGLGDPADQALAIANAGAATLAWTAANSEAWLALAPAAGDSTGEADPVTCSVSTTGLAEGTYTDAITVSAPGASNDPQTVSVTLHVGPPDEYTLTVGILGNGTVVVVPSQPTYHYGDVVELTAVPNPHWYFDGWQGDQTGSDNPLTVRIVAGVSVTAVFEGGGEKFFTCARSASGRTAPTAALAPAAAAALLAVLARRRAAARRLRGNGVSQ